MFVNQVNLKDLFSTNPSHLLGSRNTDEEYTQAVETGHENCSQFPFSQNDFNDSQEYSQQHSSLSQSQSQRSDSPNKSHNNNKVKINKKPLSGFTSTSKLSNVYGSLHESKVKAARERDEKELINNLWTAFKENCNENQIALQTLRNDVKQEIHENKNLLSTQIEQHINCLKHKINSLNLKLEPFEAIEKELNNIKQSLNDWCEDQNKNCINKRENDFENWSSFQKTVEKSMVQLQGDVATQIRSRLDEQTDAINTQTNAITENHKKLMSELDLSHGQNLMNKISNLLEEWKRSSESEQTLSKTLDIFKDDFLSSFNRMLTDDRLCKETTIYDQNMKAFFNQLARENQSIQSAQYDQMSSFAVKEHDQIKRLLSSQLNGFLQSFEENINKNLTEIWNKNTQTLLKKFENHKQEINSAIDEKLNTFCASLSGATHPQRNNVGDTKLNARKSCNSVINKGKNSVGKSYYSNSELDTYMPHNSSEIYRNSSAYKRPIERFESTQTVLVSPMLSNPRYSGLDRKNMKITKLCEYNMSPDLQQFQKVSTFENNSELAVSPFTKDIYSNKNQYASTVKESWPSTSRTLKCIDQDKENSLVDQSSMPVSSKQTVTLYKNFNQSVVIPPDMTFCSAQRDIYKFNDVESSHLETPLRKTYSRNYIAIGNDSHPNKPKKQKTVVEKPPRKRKEKVSKKPKSGSKNKYFKSSPLINTKMEDKSYLKKDGNNHMEVDHQGDGLQSCDSSPGISLSESFINHNNATLTRAMRTYRRSKADEEITAVTIASSSPADDPSATKKKKPPQTKSEKRKKPRGRKSN